MYSSQGSLDIAQHDVEPAGGLDLGIRLAPWRDHHAVVCEVQPLHQVEPRLVVGRDAAAERQCERDPWFQDSEEEVVGWVESHTHRPTALQFQGGGERDSGRGTTVRPSSVSCSADVGVVDVHVAPQGLCRFAPAHDIHDLCA